MTHEKGVVWRHMHIAMQLWTGSIDECVQSQAMTMSPSVGIWYGRQPGQRNCVYVPSICSRRISPGVH